MNVNTILKTDLCHHVFQPLYLLSDWRILGYEAFFRSNLMANSHDVFSLAQKTGTLYKLDTYAVSRALLTFSEETKGSGYFIFLNVFPSTLLHPSFFSYLDKLLKKISISCQQIVFEVIETEKIEDMKLFREVICRLRNYGFYVAVDDIGKGVDDIQKVLELEPHFIKLDRYFSVDLSKSPQKQKFIKLMIDFCRGTSHIVLEGIEKPVDLAMAKILGVPIAQGFLLEKPDLLRNVKLV